MDYWDKLQWYQYDSLEDFWAKNPISNRHFLATTKTNKYYFTPKYDKNDFIYFGREDAGLPEKLLENNQDKCINIPMVEEARSLNIANAVSVVAYEVVKQNIDKF